MADLNIVLLFVFAANVLIKLLAKDVFAARYRAQFFKLADIFLSSALVPAYTVAAFAKKFARLGMSAPPAGAMLAIAFIHNLIRRHPSVIVLLHRPQKDAEGGASGSAGEDVYNEHEQDPAKTRAVESSLWEEDPIEEVGDRVVSHHIRSLVAFPFHFWTSAVWILLRIQDNIASKARPNEAPSIRSGAATGDNQIPQIDPPEVLRKTKLQSPFQIVVVPPLPKPLGVAPPQGPSPLNCALLVMFPGLGLQPLATFVVRVGRRLAFVYSICKQFGHKLSRPRFKRRPNVFQQQKTLWFEANAASKLWPLQQWIHSSTSVMAS
eukprot:gene8559-33992_t